MGRRRRRPGGGAGLVGAITAVDRISPAFIGYMTTNTSTDGTVGFAYVTTDIQEDDLFIALVAVNDRGAAPTISETPDPADEAGWVHLGQVTHEELCFAVFYKRATGSETGTIDPFVWTGDGIEIAMAQAWQFRFVDWTGDGPFGALDTETGDLTSLSFPTVEADGENALAVVCCAFSDNINEPAGTVTATGGTWAAPRGYVATVASDDLALQLYQAEIANDGDSLTGGSLSITATAPQSSRSAAIGFALKGKVDAGETIVTATVAASADDAGEDTGTTAVVIDNTTEFFRNIRTVGLRFADLAELDGKTITFAQIQFTAAATQGSNGVAASIAGEDADAAAQYAASNANISGRTTTTATMAWPVPPWTDGDRLPRQRTPDLTAIVQEIVDRAGYNGVLNFIITGSTTSAKTFAAQDHATYDAATLTVRYTD